MGGSDWQDEIEEIHRRQQLAAEMGGRERVERQRSRGKLTVRERIAALLDDGSFREWGSLAGEGQYDADGQLTGLRASSCLTGPGELDGRTVVVSADDFTIRGGSSETCHHEKNAQAEIMAAEYGLPLVRLLDGTGGGGSVAGIERLGADLHASSGSIDDVVESEADAFARTRWFLSCLPSRAGVLAMRTACDDPADRSSPGSIRPSRAIVTIFQSTVPWCAVILRRVFGVAGAGMMDRTRFRYRLAWPSGDWGSLPAEGGIEAAFQAQIEGSPDPEAAKREIRERLERLRSPFRSAERFYIEEIIAPSGTRRWLCEFANLAAGSPQPRAAGFHFRP